MLRAPGIALAMAVMAASPALGRAQNLPRRSAPQRVPVPVFLQVTPRNDLTFGTVLPGVVTIITPHDVMRAALFEIEGPTSASVRIEFALPPALTNFATGVMPIKFGPGDGYRNGSPGGHHGGIFDPRQPLITTLGHDGKLYIRLGGRVQPTVPQQAGAYRATITLSVYDLGS